MRAVMLEVDERLIAERNRLGLDKRDEMWDGVLHMVPPASRRHQAIELELAVALRPAIQRRSWHILVETGVFAADDDYKVPDLVVFDEAAGSDRGVDGAPELVIEIRSPGDETTEKVRWYLAHGARSVLVVDRDTLAIELDTPAGRVAPAADGTFLIPGVDVRIGTDGTSVVLDGTLLDL